LQKQETAATHWQLLAHLAVCVSHAPDNFTEFVKRVVQDEWIVSLWRT
jgi:hypothetical protein